MDKEEVKRTPLPEGFTLEPREKPSRTPLPAGFTLEPKTTPAQRDQEKVKKAAGMYYAPEKTAEELKKMSVREKMDYIEELGRERELLTGKELTKGLISGGTFGFSENIDALKPMQLEGTNPYAIWSATGKAAGSLIPLSKLASVFEIGMNPISRLVTTSPIFQRQLSSLGSMFLTGATDYTAHKVLKGETPSAEELLDHGKDWVLLDMALQLGGKLGVFAKSLFTRSQASGVPRTQLVNQVSKELAESGIDMNDATVVSNKALEILNRPLTEMELAQGQKLLGKQEASQVSDVAQGVLGGRLSAGGQEAGTTFKTAKGSTYTVDGSGTTRNKAARKEHGSDFGPQPTSEKTFYVTPEQADKLSAFQTQGGGDKKLYEFPDGRVGVMLTTGPNAGKVMSTSVVTPSSTPEVGKLPVEIWQGGDRVHFGNKITEVSTQPRAVTPTDLKTKPLPEGMNMLNTEIRPLSEPYQPRGVDFRGEAQALEETAVQQKIDSVGTRAASEEELGTSIREDVKTQLESKKAEYRPLYNEAKEKAQSMRHNPAESVEQMGERLKKLERLRTQPEGYAPVIKKLEDALHDSGYVINRYAEGPEKGMIERIVQAREPLVSDSIELAIRLNEIVDYEAVEPSVKDALEYVTRALKRDIRKGLAPDADALAAFELAEQAHADTASKYSTNAMRKLRGEQAGEKISKMAESPSTFGNLKETLSPEQFLQLEREMLEKMNAQNYKQAQKTFKNLERHMTAENRKLAKEIVESKNPHNPEARKQLMQEGILDEMSQSIASGARPKKTLDLWKTPKGQRLVKDTFRDSPNWPAVKDYLEKQSFSDMVESVVKDGKIDLKKYKEFMRDPATVANIREAGGEEAVSFFKSLDGQVKQLQENARLLEKFPSERDGKRARGLLGNEGTRGQQILQKKTEVKRVGEKALKVDKEGRRQKRIDKKSGIPKRREFRGKKILERMVEKDFPTLAKVKKWKDWFTELTGITPKASMSMFGLMHFTAVPKTVLTLFGMRMMNRMLTSRKLRDAFREAAKHHTDPLKFIMAVEGLAEVFDEEDVKKTEPSVK